MTQSLHDSDIETKQIKSVCPEELTSHTTMPKENISTLSSYSLPENGQRLKCRDFYMTINKSKQIIITKDFFDFGSNMEKSYSL